MNLLIHVCYSSKFSFSFFQVQVLVELALEIDIFSGSLGELIAEISGQNFTMTLHSGSALYKIRFIASVKN